MADLQVEYEVLDTMVDTLSSTQENLAIAIQNMTQAAALIEGGALIGDQGTYFKAVIEERINPMLDHASAKFADVISKLNAAKLDIQQADAAGSNHLQS